MARASAGSGLVHAFDAPEHPITQKAHRGGDDVLRTKWRAVDVNGAQQFMDVQGIASGGGVARVADLAVGTGEASTHGPRHRRAAQWSWDHAGIGGAAQSVEQICGAPGSPGEMQWPGLADGSARRRAR
jgi:hypothetical protein